MADPIRTADADPIPRADLAELGTATGRAVSVFMPTARSGAGLRENPIRAKALLKQAETDLRANGATREEAAGILRPLVEFLDDDEFWKFLADGLALFAGEGIWRAYRVTTPFPEVVLVGDSLAVRPIVPNAIDDREFLILAGSQNKVRLFAATASTVRELDLGSIPSSLEAADGDIQPPSTQHQSQRFSPGASGGPVHGHGSGPEPSGAQVEKFLRQVAQGLREQLEPNDRRLVVLAAVGEHLSQFRGYLSYANLAEEFVPGNPDTLSPAELHKRAWPVVRSTMRKRAEAVADRFGDALGAGRAMSAGATEILQAAREGRVDTLLLTTERCSPLHGPDDLDAAIGHTVANSGSVVVADELPGDVAEGAILRF